MMGETLILVVYSTSLLFVILGVSIGFYWICKKLDKIISLIASTNSYKENDIRYAGNKGQDDLPDGSYTAGLDNSYQHNTCEKNDYDRGKSGSHSDNIAELLSPKQLRFSRTRQPAHLTQGG